MSIETSLELNAIIDVMSHYASFSLGKKLVLETKPSYQKLIIQQENERIQEALQATIMLGPLPIEGFHDISSSLEECHKGRTLTANELLEVITHIQGIRSIVSYKQQLNDVKHESLDDLLSTLVEHKKLETILKNSINEYGEIKDNASNKLKSIRSQLRTIDSEIAKIANTFIKSHKDTVVDSIVTNRNGRTVVLVKAQEKNTFGGYIYGDSNSGNASYIEPPTLIAINNKKATLLSEEQEEVNRILKMCSLEVSKVTNELQANLDTVAILDCLFAKAKWGKDRDCTVANMTNTKEICIESARHPLIDPDVVISNSYHIDSNKRILLITGPNTGGKTVSLKIIGLFTLMSYCGMPIPCEKATIPFFDRVFVDIGDDQSVQSSLSSFSSHMSKQAEVCQKATKDSLVLLDEVGSGTDPREGEALAISILNDLREKGCMAVITTHYDRLKAYGKRHDDILVSSVQFNAKTLSPTYKYIEGISGQSNAFEIAERYGLPKSIVNYARHLKNQAKSEEDTLIERLEKELNEVTLQKQELDQQIKENKELQLKLIKQKDTLDKEKENLQAKSKKEADEYVSSIKKKADSVLKDIRKKQENIKYHEALETVSKLNSFYTEEESGEALPENHEYKVGDAVELKGNSQVCEIIAIKKKDIIILMNGREVHVKQNQIRPSIHVIPKRKNQTDNVSISSGRNMFTSMSLEVNLIGLHVDEAMEKMDSYMDQASLNGLKSFRIIHGDGTGRLRKAVHESLKNNKNVKEFRLGMPQEGGTGATIVFMK